MTASVDNRSRNAFIIAFLLHFLLGGALYFNRETQPPQIEFTIELEPTGKRISEKDKFEIREQIEKVEAARKAKQKSEIKAEEGKDKSPDASESSSASNRPVDATERFERDFEDTLFTRKDSSQTVTEPGGRGSAENDWQKEGKSGGTGNKATAGENVKVPDGKTGTGGISWQGGYTRRLIYMPKIPYPEYYRRRGIQTGVLLQIEVNPSGQVVDTRVLRSSGYSKLDILARNSVRKARFSGTAGSQRNDIGEITVNFKLKGS